MAAKDFQLTLGAAAVRVSDVYGGPPGANPDAALDIPYRQLFLSSRGAAAFIGAAGDYPIVIGSFDSGPIKLSDFWAAGAGATLHILGIPY